MKQPKRIVVLGSTGSIGRQTLDVVQRLPDRLKVVGLAADRNSEVLQQQAAEFGVEHVALCDEKAASSAGILGGLEAVCDLARLPEADLVVVSVAGVIGLVPTVEAIRAGKDIALASKEVLVAAGEIVMPLLAKHGCTMTPIDSEHSAVFQCLQDAHSPASELFLTASGGPFRGWTREQLADVTVQMALNHPTWTMGGKITVDSATMMNKGLETIEAQWLFNIPIDDVHVVVHPQSVVHSMVKFADGSVLGQLGWPDMRLPIQYALLYPDRVSSHLKPWNPIDTPNLTFESVDERVFSSLSLARESAKIGKTMPCALNAANEEAANAFLREEIPFLAIPDMVQHVMNLHKTTDVSLESLLQTDAESRQYSREFCSKVKV